MNGSRRQAPSSFPSHALARGRGRLVGPIMSDSGDLFVELLRD